MICILAPDINKCQYYEHKSGKCGNPLHHNCGFCKSEPVKVKKKEKWFEKYYKGHSTY